MISMMKNLKIADYFTLGNFISGILAIIFAINMEFTISAILILLAVVFDFLDGRIARKLKQTNELGKQLDSFSDLVSFGLAPAIFGYQQGLNSLVAIIILIFFSLCGMLRLARFNITKIKGFEGVPITTNGIVFPLVYFIFLFAGKSFNDYILIIYLLMGLLMISRIRIKKL